MGHDVIIRGKKEGYGTDAPGNAGAELSWSPGHDETLNEQAEQFKQKLKLYYKAVGMEVPDGDG